MKVEKRDFHGNPILIASEKILMRRSHHRWIPPIDDDEIDLSSLDRSLRNRGLLTPLVVHRKEGVYHLVDGFKRLHLARLHNWRQLPCQVLKEETPWREILEIVFWEQRSSVLKSAVNKACFVAYAMPSGDHRDEDYCVNHLLPALGWQPSKKILKQCLSIVQLPDAVLTLAASKKFSLKQCHRITRYHPDAVNWLFDQQRLPMLALTASIVHELLDGVDDLAHKESSNNWRLALERLWSHLVGTPVGTPQERTAALRRDLRQKRYPVLTTTNERLNAIRNQLTIPKQLDLQWDPTLERHELRISMKMTKLEDLDDILKFLKQETTQRAMVNMLTFL